MHGDDTTQVRAWCTQRSWQLARSVCVAFESGKNRRLVREGVQRSTVQHADYRSTKTRKSAQPGCCCVTALQHSLTAPEVLHPHRLIGQSERFGASKMQRCRDAERHGLEEVTQACSKIMPSSQRQCSSTITTSRRAGRSQQLHAPPVGLQ